MRMLLVFQMDSTYEFRGKREFIKNKKSGKTYNLIKGGLMSERAGEFFH